MNWAHTTDDQPEGPGKRGEVDDHASAPSPVRPIGGFFGLALEDVPQVSGSVWEAWTRHYPSVSTFGTGREALAALVRARQPGRVWLPAYFCGEAARAVGTAAAERDATLLTYGLTDDLDPDMSALDAGLSPGDLVVVVDYFGWPPGLAFRRFAKERADIVWVEDRAQALWSAEPPWAPWCVFSPRKLLGVPNGGLLLGGESLVSVSERPAPADLTPGTPETMRFEDRDETHNELWYRAYRAREEGFAQRSGPMARTAEALLRRIPIAPLVAARQTNYRYLRGQLGHLAPWPRSAAGVAPFGLVIAVEDSADLARRLAGERLFCARHWPEPAADPQRFPFETSLSRHLITLPCDHRYEPRDLARLVQAIERIGPKPAPSSRKPS